jgi:YD repeat-containing protein
MSSLAHSADTPWWLNARGTGAPQACQIDYFGADPLPVVEAFYACWQGYSQPGETFVMQSCKVTSTAGPGVFGFSSCVGLYTNSPPGNPNAAYQNAIENHGTRQCPTDTFLSVLPNDPNQYYCYHFVNKLLFAPPPPPKKPKCHCDGVKNPSVGDPIYPLTGAARQDIDLGIVIGGIPITLTYDTTRKVPEVNNALTWVTQAPLAFGPMWQTNLHRSITLRSPLNGALTGAYSSIEMDRGSSQWATASVQGLGMCASGGGGAYTSDVDRGLSLSFTGNNVAGTLTDAGELTEEVYDPTGALTSMARAQGGALTFAYDSGGLLRTVTDQFGHAVQFTYEQPASPFQQPRIKLVTAPDGAVIQASYDDSSNLTSLQWADSNSQSFAYANAALPWALTSVIDENNNTFAMYGYDSQGRANSTSLAGGVQQFSVAYSQAPAWLVTSTYVDAYTPFYCRVHTWQAPSGTVVTKPNGQKSNLVASTVNGSVAMSSNDQPAGSGSAGSTESVGYDALGNVTQHDDFNGNRTCYAYDAKNRRIATLEGLSTATSCPTDLAGYVPPAPTQAGYDAAHPQRKTSVKWHTDWNLETQRAEPKKITTWSFNGVGSSSCVPSGTTLPDGKPLAVVCSRTEQATTDETGGANFAGVVVGAARTWSYTYNQYGQVLTVTVPKQSPSDTPHTTTYTYYSDTSFPDGVSGHTMGDLQQVQDALGNVTQYTAYDKAGRLLSSTDVNGTVTTRSYTPRGWLHTVTVTPAAGGGAAQTTTYDYWPTGLLHVATQADGSTLTYSYDDAHRLTDVVDTAGNKVHYVLDNMGNRTSEQLSDASGTLGSAIARTFDNLNRLQAVVGAPQ